MSDGLRQYIVECLREAPLAWRKGAIIMTVVINSAMLGLIYFGAQLRSYPTAYFFIGTAALAALDVIVIFPFKLWRANKAEIARLKGKHAGARKELWTLRQEGVQLRNEGRATRTIDSWTEKFERWHSEVLKQSSMLSMDLRHSLDPVDKIEPKSIEPVAVPNDAQHQINVSVMVGNAFATI